MLRLLCGVCSCFAHHLVSANTCKAKPHHSLDVYQPPLSFLPQGRKRAERCPQAEAGFPLFWVRSARFCLLVFASVRYQVVKVGKLRCCKIVETWPASLKVRAVHPEHSLECFSPCFSFNWTTASSNRISPAIADWPPRTFSFVCVRAFIDFEQSTAKLFFLYFMTSSTTWRHCIRDSPARSTRTNPFPTLQRRAISLGKVWKGRGRRRASDPDFSSTATGAARTRM